MEGKSVIIIGAGLAGLSAGIYARINGFQSQIFEHHSVPGGVAACWKRNGYLIDDGIHFMMGHKPGTALHRTLKELGATDPTLYVDMTSFGRFIHEESGKEAVISSDLEKLAADLKLLAPQDSVAIDKILGGVKPFRGRDLSGLGMSQPPELTSAISQLKDLWQMGRLFRYFSGPYSRTISDYVKGLKTPWLKDFFCSFFLPESPVWFIMMILALMADRQCAFLARGCLDFVLAIERRYKQLGGEVRYGSTVDKILVENGRAVGVMLADGEEYRADYVISAGDSYNTIFNLLDGKYINEKIKKRHESWALSRPMLTVSYGAVRELPDENPFTSIVLEDPVTIGDENVKALFVRILNYSNHFAPPGKTVIQAGVETGFEYWNKLASTNRARYDGEKKRLADEFLAVLEKYYPGISSRVEMTDVATPYTTWRYTLNRDGAWGAWLMTSKTITQLIERKLPELEHFYMAGQWVMSGGVPPVLYSGQHAVQLMCRDEKIKFTTG
jgi:phytoene desaturase